MQFLINFYVIIISIGIFLIFSLVGYLVETIKNTKNKKEDIIVNQVPFVMDEDMDLDKGEDDIVSIQIPKQVNLDDGDELLKSYDNDSSNS